MLKQSLIGFFWFLISAVVGFGFQIFAASYLGAAEFGKANYYYGFSSTIMIFACFGVQLFLPKYIHILNKEGNAFSETFWTISLLYCIIVPIPVVLLVNIIPLFLILLIIILSYLMVIFEVLKAYYVGLSKTDRSFFLILFFRILNVILFFFLLIYFTQDYSSYLIALLLAYCLLIFPFVFLKVKTPKLNISIVSISIPFYLVQISYGLFESLSRIFQGIFGTFESVAVLSVGLVLGTATAMFGEVFAKVVMPEFANAWSERNYTNIQDIFHKAARMNAYFVLPIAVFSILNADIILSLLGKGYEGGELILSLILFSSFFSSFVGPNGTLLNMTENQRYEIFNGILGLIAALVTGLWLGPLYSWGIAFAIMFAELVRNSAKAIEVATLFKLWPYKMKTFYFIITLLIINVIINLMLKRFISGLTLLLAGTITILLSYALTLHMAPDEEDKTYLNDFKKMISRFR